MKILQLARTKKSVPVHWFSLIAVIFSSCEICICELLCQIQNQAILFNTGGQFVSDWLFC